MSEPSGSGGQFRLILTPVSLIPVHFTRLRSTDQLICSEISAATPGTNNQFSVLYIHLH
ncbi:unnamed protein product, partial [Rotaria magnacalcarata]